MIGFDMDDASVAPFIGWLLLFPLLLPLPVAPCDTSPASASPDAEPEASALALLTVGTTDLGGLAELKYRPPPDLEEKKE